jgi:hypothetical protein
MRDAPYTSDLRARGNTLAAILDRLEREAEGGTTVANAAQTIVWRYVLRIIREGEGS